MAWWMLLAWFGLLIAEESRPHKPIKPIGNPIKPAGEWKGEVRDGELRDKGPRFGFVTDAAAWAKLWKAWRPTEELPKVDFRDEVVFVVSGVGYHEIGMRYLGIDAAGNVTGVPSHLRVEGKDLPGFCYQILCFKREGIKTLFGTPLH